MVWEARRRRSVVAPDFGWAGRGAFIALRRGSVDVESAAVVAVTGLRNGEMFGLRPSHVDLDALEMRIETQLVEKDSATKYEALPEQGSFRTVSFAGFFQMTWRG